MSARIAFRGDYNADACAVFPSKFRRVKASSREVKQDLRQVTIETREDGLCFWVAKPAVELEDLGSIGRDHQADVEEPLITNTVRRQAPQCWQDDALGDLVLKLGGQQGVDGE